MEAWKSGWFWVVVFVVIVIMIVNPGNPDNMWQKQQQPVNTPEQQDDVNVASETLTQDFIEFLDLNFRGTSWHSLIYNAEVSVLNTRQGYQFAIDIITHIYPDSDALVIAPRITFAAMSWASDILETVDIKLDSIEVYGVKGDRTVLLRSWNDIWGGWQDH